MLDPNLTCQTLQLYPILRDTLVWLCKISFLQIYDFLMVALLTFCSWFFSSEALIHPAGGAPLYPNGQRAGRSLRLSLWPLNISTSQVGDTRSAPCHCYCYWSPETFYCSHATSLYHFSHFNNAFGSCVTVWYVYMKCKTLSFNVICRRIVARTLHGKYIWKMLTDKRCIKYVEFVHLR
jgi:hypothetical protein